MVWTLGALQARLGGVLAGDPARVISGVATLRQAQATHLSFLANPRYQAQLAQTQAGAVLLRPEFRPLCPSDAWLVDQPYLVYAQAAQLLHPTPLPPPSIHPTAVIDPSAQLAADVHIGAHAVIGAQVNLASGVVIGPNCVLEARCQVGTGSRLVAQVHLGHDCILGARVLVHPGVVIGADGFGFAATPEGQWVKIPQLGKVQIGDEVEIGANTTIDRGALDDTVIATGVKIDNQVQIAHNVHIGAHTAIAGCVGIAGSATIGAYCTLAGGAIVLGHLKLADRVQVQALSIVTKSLEQPGVYSSTWPAQEHRRWLHSAAQLRQLEHLTQRLAQLEQRLGAVPTASEQG